MRPPNTLFGRHPAFVATHGISCLRDSLRAVDRQTADVAHEPAKESGWSAVMQSCLADSRRYLGRLKLDA